MPHVSLGLVQRAVLDSVSQTTSARGEHLFDFAQGIPFCPSTPPAQAPSISPQKGARRPILILDLSKPIEQLVPSADARQEPGDGPPDINGMPDERRD